MPFVVLGSWIAAHVYLVWRLASLPGIAGRLPRWGLVTAAVFLALSYVLARLVEWAMPGHLAAALEWIGATWMGFFLLAFTCLLAADVVTGFGRFAPGLAPAVRVGALGVALLLTLVATGQALRPPRLVRHEVRLAGLPAAADGTTFVLLTDLHLGNLVGARWLAARVEEVAALAPDLILVGGDILEGHGPNHHELIPLLGRLRAPLGVWAVTGNHEYFRGVEKSVANFEEAGMEVLRDRWVEPRPGLVLAGVDDLTMRRRTDPDGAAIAAALAGRPPGGVVLLSHSPLHLERAAREGAGLVLSGHTHGGQIWPFGAFVRLAYPVISGRAEVAGATVIVSRGTGTWGPRMRLWARSELHHVTLRSPEA